MRRARLAPTYALHAAAAGVVLVFAAYLVWKRAPLEIAQIGSSYLIFFVHLPNALLALLAFTVAMALSVAYLFRRGRLLDAAAAAAVEIGLLAGTATLVTGSIWARAAWGHWWVWEDPRLLTMAINTITYAGYALLRGAFDDPEKRARFGAVYGVLAWANVLLVWFAIRLFGKVSHPMDVLKESDSSVLSTVRVGEVGFLLLYILFFRLRFAQARAALALEDARRRAEENA